MLTDIYIKNYTVVDQLQLELSPGLSVLSGETGAGKSIIVDAVGLALGARADSKIIRHHEDHCDISLTFDITKIPAALLWLQEQNYADEQECMITRTIYQDGRSRNRINGKPCPLSLIRELASKLLVIHGQHESQTLMRQEHQQAYVDLYGNHAEMLKEIEQYYSQWWQCEKEIQELKQQNSQRDDKLSLLRYQLDELEQLNLQENEWQTLFQEHQKLHQAKQLIQNLNSALDLTCENERASAITLLQHAIDQLQSIKTKDQELDHIIDTLRTSAIHLEEASDELNRYRNAFDLSPEHLAHIEQRLTQIHDLARKHHVNPDALPEVQKSLQHKIQQLERSDILIVELSAKQQEALTQYHKIAEKLSVARQKVAKIIAEKITQYMQTLGMPGGKFTVILEKNDNIISAHGNEKMIFMIKTNPGQSEQAFAKIVSGGELSRISLALQAIFAEKENTPTFIFDEVDVGIGGKTAEIVGKLLHSLAQRSQVFCITHLPQVAAQGDHHYQVIKSIHEDHTSTRIQLLNKKERVQEIARMISGSQISTQTLAHAKQLLTHKKELEYESH